MQTGEWVPMKGVLVGAVNARRDENEAEVWRVAPHPQELRNDGWIPVGEIALVGVDTMRGAGEIENAATDCATVMQWGTLLGVSTEGIGGNVIEMGQVASEVIGVDPIEAGLVRLLLKHSASVYLTYRHETTDEGTGKWYFDYHGAMPVLPTLRITVHAEQTLTEAVDDVKLTALPTSGKVNGTDAAKLTKKVSEAYKRLSAYARSIGYEVQPVLARYRIEDMRGDTIEVGPTVLVGAQSGFQCGEGATFTVDSNTLTAGQASIAARCYTLRIEGMQPMEGVWSRLAHKVAIETSAPLEIYDADAAPDVSAFSDGHTTKIYTRLPGANSVAARHKLIKQKLQESLCDVKAEVMNPLGAESNDVELVAMTTLKRAPSGAWAPRRDAESYGSIATTAGGLVVASDPREEAFEGYSPAAQLIHTERADGAWWRAIAIVTLRNADGSTETAVRGASGSGVVPKGFSPVWYFPDRRAERMTIALQTAEGTWQRTTRLTAASSANFAYSIEVDSSPWLPDTPVAELPNAQSSVKARQHAGVLQAGTYASLSDHTRRSRLLTGRITALAEWPSGSASLDYSRSRIAIGSRSGVYQAIFNTKQQLHSIRLMSSQPVEQPFGESSGREGRMLTAHSRGKVMRIAGQKVQLTAMLPTGTLQVGYEPRHDELWWTHRGTDGAVRLHRTWRHGTLQECSVADYDGIEGNIRLLHRNGSVLLQSNGGLHDPERAERRPVKFALRQRYELPRRKRLTEATELNVRVRGTGLKGCITIAGDRGSRVAEPIVAYDVEGDLNADLPTVIAGVWRPYVEQHTELDEARGDCEVLPMCKKK